MSYQAYLLNLPIVLLISCVFAGVRRLKSNLLNMTRRKAEFIGSAFFVFDHYRLQSSLKSQITKVKTSGRRRCPTQTRNDPCNAPESTERHFFCRAIWVVVSGALNVSCFSAIGQVKIFYFIAALILYPIL